MALLGLKSLTRSVEPQKALCLNKFSQVVSIVWVDEDKAFNIGIKSVLDGKPMDGISSLRIHSGPDMTQVAEINLED